MSSLETIKQELIKQKAILENKGFEVPITNRNPSPIEITNAISNIDIKLSETTATEEDVRAGKTFISQTQGIRTGVLNTDNIDIFKSLIDKLIDGTGVDITTLISPNITRIRPYAFWTDSDTNSNMFYATNFTVPSNIKTIGKYAFCNVKLSGKLTIPETCTFVATYAFEKATMEEVEMLNGLGSTCYYIFNTCNNLKKITFGPLIKYFPSYFMYNCALLDEVIIKTSQATWNNSTIYGKHAVTKIIFEASTPCPVNNQGFKNFATASLLVPYEYYDLYFNATNYQQYSNPMYGFGDFITGKTLPATQEIYSLVWYSSLEDLKSGLNPVTSCSTDGRYYAVFTET